MEIVGFLADVDQGHAHGISPGEGRIFFFLKKKEAKKTSFACTRAGRSSVRKIYKSFLVLFFKKEHPY
jgi:hypothetical protein